MQTLNLLLKKVILCLIMLKIATNSLLAQSDFRNVKWGMTIDEVKSFETVPLTEENKSLAGYRDGKEFYNGIDLVYENSTVSERAAKIIYHFTNGKLSEIRVVFTATVAQKFDEPLSSIIKYYYTIFENLERKGFKFDYPLNCSNNIYEGPNLIDENNQIIYKMKDWRINDKMLDLIDEMINAKHYKYVQTRLESPRTNCVLFFSTVYEKSHAILPFVFYLTPQYNVKKEIKYSDF